MPVTGLRIPMQKGGHKNIHVVTAPVEQTEGIPEEVVTSVMFHECDENFKHTGKVDVSYDPRSEESYHRQLRAAAAREEQLITSQCTNPEWNPEGYVKNYECNSESDNAEGGSKES